MQKIAQKSNGNWLSIVLLLLYHDVPGSGQQKTLTKVTNPICLSGRILVCVAEIPAYLQKKILSTLFLDEPRTT